MLDIKFLRILGIKENLLPKADADRNESAEQACTNDLPLAGEFMVPLEMMGLSEEELRRFIIENHTQDNPFKCVTPHGHIVAIYPDSIGDSGGGRYDVEFTLSELQAFLQLAKSLDVKPTTYKTREGQRLSWKYDG